MSKRDYLVKYEDLYKIAKEMFMGLGYSDEQIDKWQEEKIL